MTQDEYNRLMAYQMQQMQQMPQMPQMPQPPLGQQVPWGIMGYQTTTGGKRRSVFKDFKPPHSVTHDDYLEWLREEQG